MSSRNLYLVDVNGERRLVVAVDPSTHEPVQTRAITPELCATLADFTEALGVAVLHKMLEKLGISSTVTPMSHSTTALSPSTTPPSLSVGIRAWENDLVARNRVDATLAQYKEQITRIARDLHWETVADVTYESAISWLADRRRDGWSGSTYKRAATTLRSFGKSLSKSKLTDGNVLEHIESAGIISGDGSRALEVWEAQAIIKAARNAERKNRRTRGYPSLFYSFLFLSGFRYGEASDLRWKQLDLDDEMPTVWSNPENTKNKQRMAVGLSPELTWLLRRHRDRMTSTGPDERVFSMVPNRDTWHKHRESAGVPLEDKQEHPATFHSTRKSFYVWLGMAGVPETIVEAMTRHVDTVGRKSYNRAFIGLLNDAAKRLPVLNEDFLGFYSHERPKMPYSSPVTQPYSGIAMTNGSTITTSSGAALPTGSPVAGSLLCDNSGISCGAVPQGAVVGAVNEPLLATQSGNADSRAGLNDLVRGAFATADPEKVARFLRSLADLIEPSARESGHAPYRTGGTSPRSAI